MNPLHEETTRAMKRLLANGPLTDMPKRPSDQKLLAILAASRFEPRRIYAEREVNDTLKAWLETFCEPYGIDHVTLRRMLADSQLLSRTKSGSTYEVNPARAGEVESVAGIEPAGMLAAIRSERQARKTTHAER